MIATDTLHRDEPITLSPLLADPVVMPDEPGPLVERLAIINDRVYLIVETDGGSIVSERRLGRLDASLYDVIPPDLWDDLAALLEAERDAEAFYLACRREQEIYR